MAMKKMKCLLFVEALLIFGSFALAQQIPQSNLYGYNRFSINPAYAGEQGCTELYFSHLNQWVKLDGAPVTSFLSVNSRIGKSLGVGGSVLIDKLGMLQQIAASGSVSYGLTFARQHNIRLGLTAGYYQFRMNPEGAIAFDNLDNIVNGGSQSSSSINSELGLLYQFKGFEFSFASKQVLETYSNFGYSGLDGYGLKRHFLGFMGYRFELNPNLGIKPSIMYKGIANNAQLDFNADLIYKNLIFGGLGYRTKVGIVGRLGLNIRDFFFVGYSYEVPMQNIAKYSSGSHELILGLKFCRKKEVDSAFAQRMVEPQKEIVVVIEKQVDTLIVERVDTVYIQPEIDSTSDQEAERLLNLASKNLEFVFDKSIILKKSHADLESLVNMLLLRPDLRISLEGHTDSNGTEAYNLWLSKNRVNAVKEFLVSNGVAADRIDTAYFGESKPIASNETLAGQAKNRRVEMKYIKKEE
jgi:type IX secretion system PorP/SprF family membrane protein